MKRIFSIISVILLVLFSFYYTDSAVNIVKRNDPIMKEIIKVSNTYEVEPINATLVNNNIIPGVSGNKLDIDASYTNMKRLGKFNKSLLKLKKTKPSISISNTFDKYVVSGNKNKHQVSLIFKINDDSHINEILEILSNYDITVTFFLDYDMIMNNPEVLKLIQNNNHEMSYLGKYQTYEKQDLLITNEILTKYNKNNSKYCYSEKEDEEILKACSNEHLHTIIPSINTKNSPYNLIKPNITNGSIIKLENSKVTIKELPYIINYINSKGYKIVSLAELLKE